VDVKVRTAHNLFCACRRANGVKWDLRPRVVQWLFVFIIRPSITFVSLVWWPGCQTASAKKILSRIQRLACLWITQAMCTTPTSAMEALTFLPPLEFLVQRSKASCTSSLESGKLVLPSSKLRI